MQNIFYKPKLETSESFKKKVKHKLLSPDLEQHAVAVPYGLQLQTTLCVNKPMRCVLHAASSGGHHFVAHFGAGVNNQVAVWSQDSVERQPRKASLGGKIDYRILKMVYIHTHYVYVAACHDLILRIFGSHFNEHSRFVYVVYINFVLFFYQFKV